MILPMGEIDAKGKNPDVRSGFDISIPLYAGREACWEDDNVMRWKPTLLVSPGGEYDTGRESG
jgi:hypothetical protein